MIDDVVGWQKMLPQKMITEDAVGWHHLFNGHEPFKLQETVRDRGLACSRPGGHKESDTLGN